MARSKYLKIWHVGNWCIYIGQKCIESPFVSHTKDIEMLNYAQPFVDALSATPGAEVRTQPSWALYRMPPEEFEAQLSWATTIIFDDVCLPCLDSMKQEFERVATVWWKSAIWTNGAPCSLSENTAVAGSAAG